MAQTGYTPLLIYASGTASNVPLAANLTSSASGAELALNYADGRLFYKDSGGVVQVLATKGTGAIGGSNTQVQYNSSGSLAGSANLTFDGTNLATTGTASATKLIPTGGTATGNGMYLPSANTLGFSTNGVLNMSLDSSGNLIVGGTSALVSASGRGNITVNGSTDSILSFGSAGVNTGYLYATTSGMELASIGSTYVRFSTNGSERMRLDSSGNLGIGTSSPAYKLAVQGSAYITSTVGIGTTPGNYGGQVDIYANSNAAFNGIWVRNDSSGASANAGIVINASGNSWRMAMGSTANNNNALFWAVDAGSPTTLMTLSTSGNLGLGVTPSAWNSAYKVFQFGRDAAIWGQTTDASTVFSSNAFLDSGGTFKYISTDFASYYAQTNSVHSWAVAASGTAGNAITFTQAMTLDASGNLGIGTSSPGAKLTVNGQITRHVMSANNGTSGFELSDAATGGNSIGAITRRDNGVSIGSYDYVSFFTGSTSGIGSGTERARITGGGDLLVGDTANSAGARLYVKGSGATSGSVAMVVRNSTPSDLLYIRNDGLISLGLAANSPYNYTTGSAANAFLNSSGELQRSTSSLRYKTNVQEATHGLAEVLALRAVTYKGINDGDKVFGGLIAEEVHDSGLTEFVAYDEEGRPDALHYGNMVSVLVKAIQEQQAIIEQLKADVAALKGA